MSDLTLPPVDSPSSSSASSVSSLRPSPSGRARVKSLEIGLTAQERRRKREIQEQARERQNAKLGTYLPFNGSGRRRPQQQQQAGTASPSSTSVPIPPSSTAPLPLLPPPNGSSTARAGRRALIASSPMSAAPSGSQSARPSRRNSGAIKDAALKHPTMEREEKSAHSSTEVQLPWPRPEWLGPYPTPQPPKEAMIDPLLSPQDVVNSALVSTSASQQGTGDNSGLSPSRRHPHQLNLPITNDYTYYRPLSPPKRHICDGGPTSHLRHYMYAHRQQQQQSQHRQRSPSSSKSPRHHPSVSRSFFTASGSPLPLLSNVGSTLSRGASATDSITAMTSSAASVEVAPEAWSSWPFVNPRLMREQTKEQEKEKETKDMESDSKPGGEHSTDEEKENPITRSFDSSFSTPCPPPVPRLFSSVVSEHDRTIVFEYLRSSYSQLFQWPHGMKRRQEKFLQKQAAEIATAKSQLQSPPLSIPPSHHQSQAMLGQSNQSNLTPPADTQATNSDDGEECDDSTPLPTVLFTDAALDRLLEESRSLMGCIALLRRLDAELSLAIKQGAIGKPPQVEGNEEEKEKAKEETRGDEENKNEIKTETSHETEALAATTDESADSSSADANTPPAGPSAHRNVTPPPLQSQSDHPPAVTPSSSVPGMSVDPSIIVSFGELPSMSPPEPVVLPPRSNVRFFNTPDELIEVVRETRLYLEAYHAKVFQWFIQPTTITSDGTDSTLPVTPLSLFASATSTIFLTSPMISALLSTCARQGMCEEETFRRLRQLDQEARADPINSSFQSFDELATLLREEATAKVHAILRPKGVAQPAQTRRQRQQKSQGNTVPSTAASTAAPNELIPSPSPASIVEPSPAVLRHAAHSQAYARLLLFKFLRDDESGGRVLFDNVRDISATVGEMDALLEATSSLTLGTRYQEMWINLVTSNQSDPHTALATAVGSPALSTQTLSSVPSTSSQQVNVPQMSHDPSSTTSRMNTRPSTPTDQNPLASDVTLVPGAAPRIAASTRAYGSFLAARAIRVLRSLVHHGQTSFQRFDELIHACEAHTRKLREERVKVLEFLTRGLGVSQGSVTNSNSPSKSGRRLNESVSNPNNTSGQHSPSLPVGRPNAAASNVGLFDAYYAECGRREKARIEQERARQEQLKQNTHQFGTAHLTVNGQVHENKLQSFQIALHAQGNPNLPPKDRYRGEKSALYKSIPGHVKRVPSFTHLNDGQTGGGGAGTSVVTLTRQPSTTAATSATGVPSHIVSSSTAQREKEKDPMKFYDWSLHSPPATSSSDPISKAPSQSNLARYASSKTLPPTPSRSILLRHADPSLEIHPLGESATSTTPLRDYPITPLPPLVITPEHVDALFGSFSHLLQLPKDGPSMIPTSSPFGVAPAPSPVFDPLIEQPDEDYLLESEHEDAFNSMDLTLLLQAYKHERREEFEDRQRQLTTTPSYLAAHPLFKPMLDQINQEQRQLHQQHQQQLEVERSLTQSSHPSSSSTMDSESYLLPRSVTVIQPRHSTPNTASSRFQGDQPPQNDNSSHPPSNAALNSSSPTPPSGSTSVKRSTTAADQFVLDTSKDLITLSLNEPTNPTVHDISSSRPTTGQVNGDQSNSATSTESDSETAPLPKMLPVVLRTMELLREQGKIRIPTGATSSSSSSSPSAPISSLSSPFGNPFIGPAGSGTGSSLSPFIPNSGPIIPGGSMGSMKTIMILRELAQSGKSFFSMNELIQTVCSMRSERKWARQVQNVEKKKLIAAGITIAMPSGYPSNETTFKRRVHTRRNTSTMGSTPSSTSSIVSPQFAIIHDDGMARNTRHIHVVDENEDDPTYHGGVEQSPHGGGAVNGAPQTGGSMHANNSASMTRNESESFLPPDSFPSTIDPIDDRPPQQSQFLSSTRMGPIHHAHNSLHTGPLAIDHDRAWARRRLLTHLSTLLLFQTGDTSTSTSTSSPPSSSVLVRMADLEALLDSLSIGPRDALLLAEKLARKEREAARLRREEEEKKLKPKSSPMNSTGVSLHPVDGLSDFPPLSHPISPLLSVLTWLDRQEILFLSVSDLIQCLTTGEWAIEYRRLDRIRQIEQLSQQESTINQLKDTE